MISGLLKKIFGSRNDRLIKQYSAVVRQINALEAGISALSDDELRGVDQTEHADPQADAFRGYCVSYMLCRKYGVDARGYDFSRLPESLRDADSKTIRSELTDIRDTLQTMTGRMERALEQIERFCFLVFVPPSCTDAHPTSMDWFTRFLCRNGTGLPPGGRMQHARRRPPGAINARSYPHPASSDPADQGCRGPPSPPRSG